MMDCNPGLGCQADDQPYTIELYCFPPQSSLDRVCQAGKTRRQKLKQIIPLAELSLHQPDSTQPLRGHQLAPRHCGGAGSSSPPGRTCCSACWLQPKVKHWARIWSRAYPAKRAQAGLSPGNPLITISLSTNLFGRHHTRPGQQANTTEKTFK